MGNITSNGIHYYDVDLKRIQIDRGFGAIILGVLLSYLIRQNTNAVLLAAGCFAFVYVAATTYEPIARSVVFTTAMVAVLSLTALSIGIIWFNEYRILAFLALFVSIMGFRVLHTIISENL